VLDDLDSGKDIARHTERLLREAEALGRFPTPVEDIISAANLKQDDDPLFADSILAKAPAALAAKVRQLRGRAAAALDRQERVIYVDDGVDHDGRRRFKQLHEVTHDILPWQADTAYADTNASLSWRTRVGFEQEANQGGAELLFQRTRFEEIAGEYELGFGAVLDLANRFGASYHAAFRRYVETHRIPMAGVVLERSPCEASGTAYRRKEAVNSRSWVRRHEPVCGWPTVLRAVPYSFVDGIKTLGDQPLRSSLTYADLKNEQSTLQVEMWSNTYNVFVLLWLPRRERLRRRRVVAAGSSSGPSRSVS
jgi:Zn-dependent peptidase ImmA (M78 family)